MNNSSIKIERPGISWQSITSTLNRLLLPADKNPTNGKKRLKSTFPNTFLPWSMARNMNHGVLHGLKHQQVDVLVLKRFLDKSLSKDISFHRLLASHLQHDSKKMGLKDDMKRSLALQRMSLLIRSVIDDTKKIEINHLAKQKG